MADPSAEDNAPPSTSTLSKVHNDTNPKSTADTSRHSFQDTAQQLTDRALTFLSTASNETLGACLVGLGATTYVVLGRVGLVLMGVVGGVVLHATWEGNTSGPDLQAKAAEEKRRKEVGLDVVHRVLDWRLSSGQNQSVDDDNDHGKVETSSKQNADFSDFRPETTAALNELTAAVIRDYVKWWYHPIIPEEETFPSASRQTLVAFLVSVSNNLYRKRPADTFLNFLTNSSSIAIVFLNELSTAVAASPNAQCEEAVQTYLQMKPESSLANVLDAKHQQRKLDMVAQDILECYLDTKTYKFDPARTFLKQVLSKLIMEMTIQACSKPEFINGWIVYLLEDGEPELLKDIDASFPAVDGPDARKEMAIQEEVAASMENRSEKGIQHKRTISKAQEAMDEAMQEAQRLTQLMIEDDARRVREQQSAVSESPSGDRRMEDPQVSQPEVTSVSKTMSSSSIFTGDASESTTQGMVTPTSSQSDAQDEEEEAPALPPLEVSSEAQHEQSNKDIKAPFTSFDQLVLPSPDTSEKKEIPPLTLHSAQVTIFDDTDPGDRVPLRQKPVTDYLIQIEPRSSHYPGWMIVRKYADFETLHEVLRRIAAISGAAVFVQAHPALPNFKAHTKASLREALERYLSDAIRYQPLAESEGMKRFLEKERGMDKSPNSKAGFGWPTPTAFESMGKGMMDVLTKAPKEVAGGGKALIGGVSGVLGNKKRNPSTANINRDVASGSPRPIKVESNISQNALARQSQDSFRNASPVVDTQPALHPPMERKPSLPVDSPIKGKVLPSSASSSRPSSTRDSMEAMPVLGGDQILSLPPPPSDMPPDYNPMLPAIKESGKKTDIGAASRKSTSSTTRSSTDLLGSTLSRSSSLKKKKQRTNPPLSEQETQVAVELLFATITELYTLSSAWTLRRTLLTAAKTFLLRPGNPQLESIRQLLQTTVLDANTSDEGIALHVRKIRENALPTEEELNLWPPESSDEEKEKLRRKARKLLVERGMPQALTSVMGQAASGEALGKVFDCLQMHDVARGLVFGLMLQGMRAITQ